MLFLHEGVTSSSFSGFCFLAYYPTIPLLFTPLPTAHPPTSCTFLRGPPRSHFSWQLEAAPGNSCKHNFFH